MKRRSHHILSLILLCLCPFGAAAQKMYHWELFPSYHNARKAVAGQNKVYSLCNDNLISYQPSTQELYRYDKANRLNESRISFIRYNEQVRKLVIVYSDGNIDLIREDETVINIPQYKDKNINNKDINGLDVTGKYALLSTSFGVVLIDLDQEIIANTYTLDLKTSTATFFENKIYAATSSGVYTGDMSQNLLDKKNWKKLCGHYLHELLVFDGHLYGNNHSASLFRLNEAKNDFIATEETKIQVLQVSQGMMIAANSSKIYLFRKTNDRTVISQQNTFSDLTYGNGTFWAAKGYDGLQPYKLNSQNQLEATGEALIPDSPIRDYSNFVHYNGDRLLAVGGSLNYNGVTQEGTVMYYEDGKWTNFEDGSAITAVTKLPYTNTVNIAQDPEDPSHHFVTSARLGLYEFQDGKLLKHYSCDNSRLNSILPNDAMRKQYVSTAGAIYDKENNLWFLNNQVDTIINIIRADGSWIKIYDEKLKGLPTFDFILFDQRDRVWINSRRYSPGLYMLDHNGTPEDDSDDFSIFRNTIINQDGTSYTPDYFYCMAEDRNGEIWVGTNLGLFVISNPDEFADDNFHYTQIKVPRNDGSNYADYLLNNTPVTCIAVDGANRKWIGTTSGVYLVSADGLETIHHFTADNSPLISNNINSIAVDPVSGRVMIATDKGLAAYNSDASEPAESLEKSGVSAYPNPVRPEYNGYITVKGLTPESSVKITSSNGQLVGQGTSNGGIFTWNGRDKRGRRVASGVYNVLATDREGKESVVTRIIMIR